MKRGTGEGGQKLEVGNELFTVQRRFNRKSCWWMSYKFREFLCVMKASTVLKLKGRTELK